MPTASYTPIPSSTLQQKLALVLPKGVSLGRDLRGRLSSYSCYKGPNAGYDSGFGITGTLMEYVMDASDTPYIDVPYDPYPIVKFGNSAAGIWQTFIPTSYFPQSQIDDLKQRFKIISRTQFEQIVWQIFTTSSTNPSIRGKDASALIASGLKFKDAMIADDVCMIIISVMVKIFNDANKEIIAQSGLSASEWEYKKFINFATKDVDSDLAKYYAQVFNDPVLQPLAAKELKQKSFSDRIANLPKSSDPGINLQRDIALTAFLAQEQYNLLDLLLDFYETLSPALISNLQKI